MTGRPGPEGGRPRRPAHHRRSAGIRFTGREVRDLLVAWLALGVAFAILFAGGGTGMIATLSGDPVAAAELLVVSLLTAGVGFLLHELAHKVAAVRFGQKAAFRADYGMLGLAVLVSLAGFIFAAPGAVYHSGRITERESGLVALAGPVTNLALAGIFLLPGALGVLGGPDLLLRIGLFGVVINLFLAGFNMLPFGPLDGRTVLNWSLGAYVLVTVPSVLLAVGAFVVWI